MVEAMADSNRVQTFLAVGLFFGILLLSYNYWALSEERTLLSQKVKDSDAKYNDLNEKRSFIEKQIEANTNQIQTMEKKITESGDSLKTKDAEIEALLGKMNQTGLSIDSLLTEMEKVKDQLSTCEENSATQLEMRKIRVKFVELEDKYSKDNSNSSCLFGLYKSLDGYVSKLVNVANTSYTEGGFNTKFIELVSSIASSFESPPIILVNDNSTDPSAKPSFDQDNEPGQNEAGSGAAAAAAAEDKAAVEKAADDKAADDKAAGDAQKAPSQQEAPAAAAAPAEAPAADAAPAKA